MIYVDLSNAETKEQVRTAILDALRNSGALREAGEYMAASERARDGCEAALVAPAIVYFKPTGVTIC